MQQFLDSIRNAIRQENWFGALFMALAMPDVCGKLDTGDTKVGRRYRTWAEKYLCQRYSQKLNADVFFQLRNACLHSGTHVETNLGARLLLVTPHESPFHDSNITLAPGETYVHLRIDLFCEDVCSAVEKWLYDVKDRQSTQNDMQTLLHLTGDPSKAHKLILGDVSLQWGGFSSRGLYTDLPARKGFRPFWLNGGRIPEDVLEVLGDEAKSILEQKVDRLKLQRDEIVNRPREYAQRKINDLDQKLGKKVSTTAKDPNNKSMHEHLKSLQEKYKQEPIRGGQVDQDLQQIENYIAQTREQLAELQGGDDEG